jgi:hypothetical protein
MRRILIASLLTVTAFTSFAATTTADVIVSGPFGGRFVVIALMQVQVGPGVAVSAPPAKTVSPPAPPTGALGGAVIVSKSVPVYRPEDALDTLPAPRMLTTGQVPPPRAFDPSLVPSSQGPMPLSPGAVLTPIPPRDFVKAFQPIPGKQQVLFLHPVTGKAVPVAFDLPPGNPRKVAYIGHLLVLDYGRHDVTILFQLSGKVKVTQR